ncbi:guanylate kinase [Sinimarinibacterium sp. CAU 1509]|uniref:guanylate kinase n=1 Tax=Sinimarinibacterium sp. CAU 1509 TaxID=2562283 RepID=UPI0010AC7C01|nr:guanylate kinase [Sinimarinibacterium sp. CAU 1509]TJY58943.1 guanylate kinase [Sinimarinibacterium sp. CAU 1509]
MTHGNLIIVSAPSGGGKTSLTRALLPCLAERGIAATISVSYTTRAPRSGETDGTHYHFVDDAEFLRMIDAGQLLEHAEVFGRRYGTGRQRTEELLAQGQDVILDIDWQGARQVRQRLPEVRSVFILPPSLEELERRLRGRSQDDEETIARRMREARQEMSHYDEYDFVVVNDVFERALEQLTAVFVASRLARVPQQAALAGLIDALLGPAGA